jgi:hypothetical protein
VVADVQAVRCAAPGRRVAHLDLGAVEVVREVVDDPRGVGVGRHEVGVAAGVRLAVEGPGVPLAPQADQAGLDVGDARVAVVPRGERGDELVQCAQQVGAIVIRARRSPVSALAEGDVPVEAVRDGHARVGAGATGIFDVEADRRRVAVGRDLGERLVDDGPVQVRTVRRVAHHLGQAEVAPLDRVRIYVRALVAPGEVVLREALPGLVQRLRRGDERVRGQRRIGTGRRRRPGRNAVRHRGEGTGFGDGRGEGRQHRDERDKSCGTTPSQACGQGHTSLRATRGRARPTRLRHQGWLTRLLSIFCEALSTLAEHDGNRNSSKGRDGRQRW